MKRILFIILITAMPLAAKAQINELGIFVGGSNYVGDVGPTDYVAPNDLALGIIYKWNRSPRHAWRASFMYADISSYDSDSDVRGRKVRGYGFENTIKELSAGLEFNFFEFNLHEPDFKLTPYVYGGFSYFWYDESYINTLNGDTHRGDAVGGMAIPMTVGIKAHVFDNFIIGFEAGARYTLTDNLDGSNNSDYPQYKFGNLESDDWYVFTGFTITYTFGIHPCYCAD